MSHEDKALLIDMLGRNESPLALRTAVAEVNRNTATTLNRNPAGKAYDTVSVECVSSHLLPTGTGEAQVFGDIDKPFIPNLIQNGRNLGESAPQALAQAGRTTPHRLVGVTWNSLGEIGGMMAGIYSGPS
jgi:hypothetical protein